MRSHVVQMSGNGEAVARPTGLIIGSLVSIFLCHYVVYNIYVKLNILGGISDKDKVISMYIGYFERFILTLLVCFQQWQAMSFVITARAIVRSKEENSEYILLGTFANAALSLLVGTLCLFAKEYFK